MEYIRTIRHLNFTKLWLAQILSQVAANLLNFALIILVYNLTLESRFANFSVSLLVLSFAVPAILSAPIAGAYVDHWDRKKVLVATNALRTFLVLLYIPAANNLIWILLLTFVIAVVGQFFMPAEAAAIPRTVPKQQLLTANSLFVFSLYASFMVGYSAAGPAVAVFGDHGAYYVTAIMFGLATVFTAWLPRLYVDKKTTKLPRLHLIRQLKENWQIITAHPDRSFALSQMTITQGMVFVLITLAPALSLAVLKVPLQQASHFIIIPVGVGMVVGVVALGFLNKKIGRRRIIEASLLISGVALTLLGLSGQLYRTYHGEPLADMVNVGLIVGGIMLVLGAMNSVINATAQTLLQETTDDHNRGRVFSSLQMLINVASTVPVFVTGILADLISVTKVVSILGALLFLYAVALIVVNWLAILKAKGRNTKTGIV